MTTTAFHVVAAGHVGDGCDWEHQWWNLNVLRAFLGIKKVKTLLFATPRLNDIIIHLSF